MSKPRREYDVYLCFDGPESELSLEITFGKFMVPPNAEVFKVREVLEGDTESAEEIERLRKMMEQVDELLKAIDRPVPKDGLRSWRYDIHVARSRIIRDGEQK